MDAIDPIVLDAVADRLAGAYDSFEPVAPVRTDLEGGGVDAAYAVQQRTTTRWESPRRMRASMHPASDCSWHTVGLRW